MLRVLVEVSTAVSVELAKGCNVEKARASKEVVMAAGLFGTSHILMLSGIGPEAHLKEHGIPVQFNAPMLGENLHDHLAAHIQMETDKPISLNKYFKSHLMVWAGMQWFGCKGGVAAVNQRHVGAFLRADADVTHPNIQFHFFPVFFSANWIPNPSMNGYRLGAGPMRPESRGKARLTSADPNDAPLINPNYLASGRAILDLELKFRRIDGLRVVDASAIPPVPSATINACAFMMAEKAADMILGRPALPCEDVSYFKAI